MRITPIIIQGQFQLHVNHYLSLPHTLLFYLELLGCKHCTTAGLCFSKGTNPHGHLELSRALPVITAALREL